MTSDPTTAETTTITGYGGDEIEAYLVCPSTRTGQPGLVVLHHMPGYDEATKEIVRAFAADGYCVLMPNLHHRFAPGADPATASAAAREAGVSDDQVVGDARGAIEVLRARKESNGKVGVIGYCSGGRQSWQVACSLEVDAAVVCYGARSDPSLAPMLRCPLLGLYGNEDQSPSPADVDALEAALRTSGKSYELHRYDGAGHAFFARDRPTYRHDAAQDGWERIREFLAAHLKEPQES